MNVQLPPLLLALSPGRLELGPGFVVASGDLLSRVRAARASGLAGLLLREPRLPDRPYLELAHELRGILDEGWLGLHDRPHLVSECQAQAVHLGFRSMGAAEARECVGAEIAIGQSTHAGDDPASFECADYLFHGPAYAPLSKTGHLPPLGAGELERFARATRPPVWGLGGITPGLAPKVISAGARGVACLGGVLLADDPAAACRQYQEALDR